MSSDALLAGLVGAGFAVALAGVLGGIIAPGAHGLPVVLVGLAAGFVGALAGMRLVGRGS